jgi:hypothetical protein
MTVVPPKARGLRKGDVVRDGDLRYDTTTTFATVGLVVQPTASPLGSSFDEVDGRVRIRDLDEQSICLDMDLELSLDGELTAAIGGVVRAPVVKAPASFYYR